MMPFTVRLAASTSSSARVGIAGMQIPLRWRGDGGGEWGAGRKSVQDGPALMARRGSRYGSALGPATDTRHKRASSLAPAAAPPRSNASRRSPPCSSGTLPWRLQQTCARDRHITRGHTQKGGNGTPLLGHRRASGRDLDKLISKYSRFLS